ncbi:peptidase S8 [beta proteobacterium AAP51]|nr:peptidase S8 [beta proteobacterium AAP51]
MTRHLRTQRTVMACALAALWALAPQAHAGQEEFQPMRAAAEQPAKGLIVKYRDGAAAADLSGSGASVVARSRVMERLEALSSRTNTRLKHVRALAIGAQLVEAADEKTDLAALAEVLRKDPSVLSVEPNAMMVPLLTPNDTRYPEQWHYFEATGGINAVPAWDRATGTGVVVAVIDTGIVPHSDLNANVLPGYDFVSDAAAARDGNGRDSNARDEGDWFLAGECGRPTGSNSSWHGTHVAGTVAAVTNNAAGVAGVAFGAKILPVRALAKCGGSLADIADAIVWSAGGSVPGVPANPNPAKVINMSLGGGGACGTTYQAAINTARSLGASVVVAAGNSNVDVVNARPANCTGVIAVAATTRSGGKASFSNFGSLVDVAAPGAGILSTLNSGTTVPAAESYASYNGTSMATPHVAGVAAMLYQAKPTATPTEIENALRNTARVFPAACSGCGTGIVDANAAITAISGTAPPPPAGNVLQNNVARVISGATGTDNRFTMVVPAGRTSLSFSISGGTGDADLYVRFGTAPTTTTYDCRPYRTGNTETCTITNIRAGTYHVNVRAYSAYSNVTLVGRFSPQ